MLKKLKKKKKRKKKIALHFLQRLNTEVPYNPAVLLLGVDSKELTAGTQIYLHTHVRSRTIHNSGKDEAITFSNRRVDKQNGVHPHNGALFSHKKEGNADTCYMNLDDTMPSEISQTQKDQRCVIPVQ